MTIIDADYVSITLSVLAIIISFINIWLTFR